MNENFNGSPQELMDEIVASVPKNLQEAFVRVVEAGTRVMYSEQTHDMMLEQMNKEGDAAQNIGEGIAGLMMLLYQKSNQTMPTEIIMPAGVYLLGSGADFLEKVLKEKIPPAVLADALQAMIDMLMEKFGIQKDRFYSAVEKAAAGGYKE